MFLIKDFKGFTRFEKIFFGVFTLLQVAIITYFWITTKEIKWINVVASVSGILCLIMSAKGRLSTFFYGLIQVVTYGFISYDNKLYGEVGLQVVFGVFQFIGLYFWLRNMHSDHNTDDPEVQEVDTKGLNKTQWIIVSIVTLGMYTAISYYLENHTNAQQPYVDSINVCLNLIGQTLMTLRFKEQWFFWIAVNIVSITLWVRTMTSSGEVSATGVTMAVMWFAALINSVYGYFYWKKLQVVAAEQKGTVL